MIYSIFSSRLSNTQAQLFPKFTRNLANKDVNKKVTTLNNTDAAKLIAGHKLRLEKIAACYAHNKCNYSQNDPRAYALAIGQDLKRQLRALNREVRRLNIRDHEIEQIATEFLAVPDGHVKVAALELLDSQEPSEMGVDAVLEQVVGYHDSTLISKALGYIANLASTNPLISGRVADSLRKSIRNGSPFVAKAITKNIATLLNDDNLSFYQNLLSELSPRSTEHRYLQAALNEFMRRREGG